MKPSEAAQTIGLDQRSIDLRWMVVNTLIAAGRGHMGSALSLVEILRVLYDHVLDVRPKDPTWAERDRCILSKGHGCLALYAILADKGFFPEEELKTFCAYNSRLGGHPEQGIVPGVEASTGALGHGLSIGVGLALAHRMKQKKSQVYVVLGDGEINEGSIWEAALSASKHKLSNLTAVIDYNKLQSYGPTKDVMPLEPLAEKWTSFGFSVQETNGHDVNALKNAFTRQPLDSAKPNAIIAHTIKGKGIPMAENNPLWHHKNKISDSELEAIRAAMEKT